MPSGEGREVWQVVEISLYGVILVRSGFPLSGFEVRAHAAWTPRLDTEFDADAEELGIDGLRPSG
jgi:hypothetical protein